MSQAKLLKRATVAPAVPKKKKPAPNLESQIAATVAQWKQDLDQKKRQQFAANRAIRNGGGVR
jgi:hypothetical protein